MSERTIIRPEWKQYYNDPKLTFAPAVRKGNMLFVSGLTAVDPDTGEIVGKGDIEAQARQIYRNLEAILEAAGATFRDVVKTMDYITTRKDYKKTAAVRREYFGDALPASSAVVVNELLRKDALIEVDAVCVLGPPT